MDIKKIGNEVYLAPTFKFFCVSHAAKLMVSSLATGYAGIKDWEYEECYDEADD